LGFRKGFGIDLLDFDSGTKMKVQWSGEGGSQHFLAGLGKLSKIVRNVDNEGEFPDLPFNSQVYPKR
jgi:hypothetical protein